MRKHITSTFGIYDTTTSRVVANNLTYTEAIETVESINRNINSKLIVIEIETITIIKAVK